MFFNTLMGRFLGLTIIFAVIAEVMIFVPSMARFRETYLQSRLEQAQLAALATLASPEQQPLSADLQDVLLRTVDVYNVVIRRGTVSELVLTRDTVPSPGRSYNIENVSALDSVRSAIGVFFAEENRVIRVAGHSQQGPKLGIEIVMNEEPLRTGMIAYGLRILYVSLAIIAGTAALLFSAVQWLIVRPMKRVVESMIAYRDDPEDAGRIITPRSAAHEIKEAETALRDLQLRLTAALKQKERLAALGSAVAKISHDLRNMLTTAQLLADRMEMSKDPGVKRTAPKLVHSLSRAITLCERTLTFGKAEEPAPELCDIALAPLVAEVVENEAQAFPGAEIRAEIPPGTRARADADQLFRVLSNLVRNAAQAIEASGAPGRITVAARSVAGRCEITVADTGPGLPPKAKENLFQPFRGGARQGGSGLGLVIAAELMKGHGGGLVLAETGPGGTVFKVTLPGAG